MDWSKIGKETIVAGLIGAIACVALLSIRYTIWSKGIPKYVEQFRWLIAAGIGILIFVIEIPLGLLSEKSATIIAGVIYLIGSCLKNDPAK